MAVNFHKWEVDPFFLAAEQVQDSADRLDSAYRTWIHTKKLLVAGDDNHILEFHKRELATALGTAKWQLEEFEKAVSSISVDFQQHHQCEEDDAPERRQQFIFAIRNQINAIEDALVSSNDVRDIKVLPVVSLGQEEKNDLEQFLCGSRVSMEDYNGVSDKPHSSYLGSTGDREISIVASKPSSNASIKSASEISSQNTVSRNLHIHQKGGAEANGQAISYSDSELLSRDYNFNSSDIHHRSISVGDNLNHWNDQASLVGSYIRRDQRVGPRDATLKFSLFLSKVKQTFGLHASESGFKRWKDGDADSVDLENENSSLIGMHENDKAGQSLNIFSRRDGRQCNQLVLPVRRPVQIATAILATFGLLGLLSFHVTSSTS